MFVCLSLSQFDISPPEHYLLPSQRSCLGPGLEGILGALHSGLHLVPGGVGDLGDDLVSGGVVNINPPVSLALHPLARDDVLSGGRNISPSIAQTGSAPETRSRHGATELEFREHLESGGGRVEESQ